MDILFNESAKKEFDPDLVDEITPNTGYPIWMKRDTFGREYFGVGNFCGLERTIKGNTDLSWLEWDGNEVFVSDTDKVLLFKKTVGIIKGWISQLVENYPADRFVVFASFDAGDECENDSAMVGGCESEMFFTLRFWKKRDGQGLDENTSFNQPVIMWCNK